MPILSKLAASWGVKTLHTNCYETVHTWHPDCTKAILVAIPAGLLYALKTYASFYLVATLISKRDPRKIDWKRYIWDVLQSSAFLTSNLALFLFFLCRMRHILGFFTVFTMGGLSSFVASFCAILVEKKGRRPALALYLANLASETLFRQMVHHGYMLRIPKGECVPFGIGLSIYMYLHSKDRLSAPLTKFMNFTHQIEAKSGVLYSKYFPNDFHSFLHKLRTNFGKSVDCEHENSCISLAFETAVKNFGTGLAISSGINLIRNIVSISRNPTKLLKLLFSKGNFKIPVFFGLMPLLFHCTRCLLNRIPKLNKTTKNVTAAAVSSTAMAVFPNVTISMYTMWKGIEALYFDLSERGYIPDIPHGDVILYTLSCGYVLWQAVLEPHAIRKGYQGFLLSLTGNKLKLINRKLFDEFGFLSSKLWPYTPNLNTKYVTINPMLYQHVPTP